MAESESKFPPRRLGLSDVYVSPVAMGCWPIAGMTSLEVDDASSRATLREALRCGVTHFDTAYCYGAAGESERLVGECLRDARHAVTIATKGGIHWNEQGERVQDARPATLKRQCDESLQRLGFDHVDLLYLHAPDPQVPIAESVGALAELLAQGKTRSLGLSNVSVAQLEEARQVAPISAVQPHFNMLQREVEDDLLPYCQQHSISAMVYWPLMKGLLAGKLPREHVFAPGDGRAKYPMFQGEEWQRNQDFVDELRALAKELGRSVTEVVINWTIQRGGITAALCGAKRDYQIRESALAMRWRLSQDQIAQIDQAIERRGPISTRAAV